MTWQRAFEADARLAAKNAVKIRAALRQSINAEAIAEGYLASLPSATGNLAQSRARARAWAIMNVRVNLEPFRAALIRTVAEAYVLGQVYAEEQVGLAKKRQKDVTTGINWATWKPGDAAAALLVKPPKAFQTLLGRYGLTLKGFSDTTLNDIGNSIGESLELGLSGKQMAKRLSQYVASPSRALSIAVTEQNRAISVATVARYKEMGVEKQEWIASDPCDECEQNDGQVVNVGAPFASGDTEPPVHPNCRCALLPVVLGMEDQTAAIDGGAPITDPVDIAAPVVEEPKPLDPVEAFHQQRLHEGSFVPGQWRELSAEERKEHVLRKLEIKYPGHSREDLERFFLKSRRYGKAERSLIEKGSIYVNGDVEVHFHSAGTSVSKARRKEIIDWVDTLHTTNPHRKVTVIIGPSKKGARGWAYLGGDQIWIAPTTAKNAAVNVVEGGSFKMPVLREVPQWQYTLTHEWGHHIDDGTPFEGQSAQRTQAVVRLREQHPDAFISGYSKENTKEFVAEMFAEWFLSGGKTTNTLVQEMAKEFGWII